MELPGAISLTGTFPPIKLPEMDHGLQRRRDETEWQRVFGVCMDHRRHVWSCLKNRRMDEALQIGLALVLDGLALLIELD